MTTPLNTRRRRWLLILALVAAGGALTWYAFIVGVQEREVPDLNDGVELVQPHDRTTR